MQYVHASPKVLLVISPNVFINGDHDVQNVLVAKYSPTVSKNWHLYESTYVFSDYDPKLGIQTRNFVHARTGASYKLFTFGVGADFDWYGLPPNYRKNYGPFLSDFF